MTVLDASVVVDAIAVAGRAGERAREELARVAVVQAPQILVAESVSALRSLVTRGELSLTRARSGIGLLRSMRMLAYPIEPLLDRVWDLRDRITVYDAWYVALAERLGVDLVTADVRLTRVSGLRCRIRLPGG